VRFAQARRRVLERHGLTDADVTNMTDEEKERSTLGREILSELEADWNEQREIENKLRAQEDEADVANRREMVLSENANAESPYPPKKIGSLLRRRRKDIEEYSDRLYWIEMFSNNPSITITDPDNRHSVEIPAAPWRPAVDMQAIIKSMTAEAIHKRAFYMVGESERLTKVDRRRRLARSVLDLPKYALIGVAFIIGLFLLGLGADLLQYLHRAPTVVASRIALSRLWYWLFTDTGVMTVLVVGALVIAFMKVRTRLKKVAEDV
jgi:hypothetical protein